MGVQRQGDFRVPSIESAVSEPHGRAGMGMVAAIRRIVAALVLAWLMLAAATVAQAQNCTITASASRTDTDVAGSGTLAFLRVPATGTSQVFLNGGEAVPGTPPFACSNTALNPAARFTGTLPNPAGTNNRASLTVGWTFTFTDGSTISRPVGSNYFLFTPVAGQTGRTLSGNGTLFTGSNAQTQYAANTSYSGFFDIGQGTAATGRDSVRSTR